MKLVILALAAFLPQLASAATLTYKLDLAHSGMDETTAFDICGLPKQIQLDASQDLATVVIQKAVAQNTQKASIQVIQASGGSQVGGPAGDTYDGDYRTRVSIVTVNGGGYYKGGVVYRVEVNTFGPTTAPKGFTVDTELLNYRESAELAEDSVCTGYKYRLN